MVRRIDKRIYEKVSIVLLTFFLCKWYIFDILLLLRKNREKNSRMIAEILIHSNVKNLNRIFDYHIPTGLEEKVRVGSRVFVPFGNMKRLEDGFVIGIKEYSLYQVKDIVSSSEELVLSEDRIRLAKWMARRYFCNVSDCLRLMLPPGTATKEVANRVKEKILNFVSLKQDIEDIEQAINSGKVKSEKQIRTLRFIIDNGDVLVSDLEIFADTTRAVANTLCKNGYLEIIQKQVERNPFENKEIKRTEKLVLTGEQQYAYNTIVDSMEDMLFSEFLIYGVTGSR